MVNLLIGELAVSPFVLNVCSVVDETVYSSACYIVDGSCSFLKIGVSSVYGQDPRTCKDFQSFKSALKM